MFTQTHIHILLFWDETLALGMVLLKDPEHEVQCGNRELVGKSMNFGGKPRICKIREMLQLSLESLELKFT